MVDRFDADFQARVILRAAAMAATCRLRSLVTRRSQIAKGVVAITISTS